MPAEEAGPGVPKSNAKWYVWLLHFSPFLHFYFPFENVLFWVGLKANNIHQRHLSLENLEGFMWHL